MLYICINGARDYRIFSSEEKVLEENRKIVSDIDNLYHAPFEIWIPVPFDVAENHENKRVFIVDKEELSEDDFIQWLVSHCVNDLSERQFELIAKRAKPQQQSI